MNKKIVRIFGILGSIASIIGLLCYFFPQNTQTSNTIQMQSGNDNIQAGRDVIINKAQDNTNPAKDRQILVNTFCKLFDLWNQSVENSDFKNDRIIATKVSKLNFQGLPDVITWEAARDAIIKASDSSGFKKGMLQGEASKKIGDLMVHHNVSDDEVSKAGYKHFIKKMDALRSLMLITKSMPNKQ